MEHAYLASLSEQERYERYMQLLSSNIPCIIFCRSIKPEPKIIDLSDFNRIVSYKTMSSLYKFKRGLTLTKYFIELRGIGIIDVKTLFGVESVKETQEIDMVIKLEDWNKDREYDRLGLEEEYIEYLGNKVVCHTLPVRPGRNLAVIVESAAVNHRQKMMGYNAAKELYRRVQENLMRGGEDDDE